MADVKKLAEELVNLTVKEVNEPSSRRSTVSNLLLLLSQSLLPLLPVRPLLPRRPRST